MTKAIKFVHHDLASFGITFIIFIMLSYQSIGQANKMNSLARSLTENDFYDSSNVILLQNLNRHTLSVIDHIESLRLIGENYMNLSKFKKSDSIYQKAFKLLSTHQINNDTLLANLLHSKGRNLGSQNKYSQSVIEERKAIDIFKSKLGDHHSKIAACYNMLSYDFRLLGKYDSALFYVEKAIKILDNQEKGNLRELSKSYYEIGWIYAAKGDYNNSLKYNKLSLELRTKILGEFHLLSANCHFMIAFCHKQVGFVNDALSSELNVLKIQQKKLGHEHVNVASTYQALADTYSKLGEHNQAIEHHLEGNKLWIKLFGENNRNLVRFYNQLGNEYRLVNNQKKFTEYLSKAIRVANNNLEPNHPELVATYRSIAVLHKENQDYDEELNALNKAFDIAKYISDNKHPSIAHILGEIASNSLSRKKLNLAIKQQIEAINFLNQNLRNYHPLIAKHYINLGDFFLQNNEIKKAAIQYQNAVQCLYQDPNQENIFNNLPSTRTTSRLVTLKTLARNGMIRIKLWEKDSSDISNLYQAATIYDLVLKLIDQIRVEYDNNKDKQLIFNKAINVYEEAISLNQILYQITKNELFIEKSFAISDRSKSFILINSLKDKKAIKYSDIPDSLIQLEKQLSIKKAFYETRLARAKLNMNKKRIALYESELFDKNRKYKDLKNHLSANYSKYYNFKYGNDINRDQLEEKILKNEKNAVIEYFEGENQYYVHILFGSKIKFLQIPKSSLVDSLIYNFQNSITNFQFINRNKNVADSTYVTSASKLYDYVLKPVLDQIPETTDQLTLILDGKLHEIAFEALLTESTYDLKNLNYKKLPYLINKVQIQYLHSLDFFSKVENNSSDEASQFFGGFAPDYTQARIEKNTTQHAMYNKLVLEGRLPLPGAIEEIKSIAKITDGDSWIEKNASEQNFKTHAHKYEVLHLATHSLLNNEKPMLSELVFSTQINSSNDGFLNIGEIYNMDLNANLTVLSACNTGNGRLEKGEGKMSLARAFNYAGSPNIIMSLWKIPDQSSKRIMLDLYSNLIQKTPKGTALKNAKLKYISEVNDPFEAHPYFWAGFVLSGDNDPLNFSIENYHPFAMWIIILISIISVSLIVTWLLKLKKL